jgi:threonine aldolase
MDIIDLRSDTVTKPTSEMRIAMSNAKVGDDVYREDITIKALEERIAILFHKEDALFFPTGTMSNLTALLTWCWQRGSEFIVGDKSHMFLFEQAGAAQFGGISPRTVPNLIDGTMDLAKIEEAIREDDIHEPITRVICIENTHNACGGKVLPLSFIQDLKIVADKHHLPIHLDGARLWNAISALHVNPTDISNYVDSLSVCLSKGLGAPIGSLLVGKSEFIEKARRIRKALGGGMRQVGIIGAAGLQALDDFESGILINDHIRAQKIAITLKELKSFTVNEPVDTNIIFININNTLDSSKIIKWFREKGILVCLWAPFLIRIVIHRDITDMNIDKTISAFQEIDNIYL